MVGVSKPAIISKSDDFPQPLGPTIPMNFPLAMLNDTSSMAWISPDAV
jgi:hypothetical protein